MSFAQMYVLSLQHIAIMSAFIDLWLQTVGFVVRARFQYRTSKMVEPDKVSGVLARAAARAARLAELDTAQTSIQKLLNIDMPPEMLPWGDVMSHD